MSCRRSSFLATLHFPYLSQRGKFRPCQIKVPFLSRHRQFFIPSRKSPLPEFNNAAEGAAIDLHASKGDGGGIVLLRPPSNGAQYHVAEFPAVDKSVAFAMIEQIRRDIYFLEAISHTVAERLGPAKVGPFQKRAGELSQLVDLATHAFKVLDCADLTLREQATKAIWAIIGSTEKIATSICQSWDKLSPVAGAASFLFPRL